MAYLPMHDEHHRRRAEEELAAEGEDVESIKNIERTAAKNLLERIARKINITFRKLLAILGLDWYF